MSNFFEVEQLRHSCVNALARGFSVLTLEKYDKAPWAHYSPHAVNSATRDPKIALKAWDDCEEANYGVACGASNITVLCTDQGLSSIEEFEAWRQEHNLPETFTVISGRDGFSAHMYFAGVVKTQPFKIGKVTGELKSTGTYVVGAGSNHPSGKKYQIIKDVTLAPLPDVFKSTKPQLVYSPDGDVIIGYVENGSFVPIVLDIVEPAVQKYVWENYWHRKIVDNQVVWSNPNISKFLEGHGLTLATIMPFVGKSDVLGNCGTCGTPDLPFSASSRTDLVDLVKRLAKGSGRCTPCWEKEQAAKAAEEKTEAERAKVEAEKALTAKEQELTNYREMLILKHGKDLVTEHLCPSCADGWLVVKIGAQQIPFLGCSRYNYFRSSSCRYTSSISSESVAELLPIFQKRLEAQMAKA